MSNETQAVWSTKSVGLNINLQHHKLKLPGGQEGMPALYLQLPSWRELNTPTTLKNARDRSDLLNPLAITSIKQQFGRWVFFSVVPTTGGNNNISRISLYNHAVNAANRSQHPYTNRRHH
jgi:hypothetical protein